MESLAATCVYGAVVVVAGGCVVVVVVVVVVVDVDVDVDLEVVVLPFRSLLAAAGEENAPASNTVMRSRAMRRCRRGAACCPYK